MYHHSAVDAEDLPSVSPLSERTRHASLSPARVPDTFGAHGMESNGIPCSSSSSRRNTCVLRIGGGFGLFHAQESNTQSVDDGLSWSTIARVVRHTYLHDILCSSASTALFQAEPASPSLPSAIPSTKGLSSSSLSVTVWEQWLCAVLLRTALDADDSFPLGVPSRVNDCLARAQRWTRALVNGILRWIPSNAGPRLLLQARSACAVKASGDKLANPSAASLRVALMSLESVECVWRHWGALRRQWLSKTPDQSSNPCKRLSIHQNEGSSYAHVNNRTDALRRTVSIFERECGRALRWTGGGFAHAMRLARAMAAAANISAILDTRDPVDAICSSADALTPAQCALLAELLGPLLAEDMAAGRRRVAQWVVRALAPCPALARGPTRLFFRDLLTAVAHWIVLLVLHGLASRASAAMGTWDEESVLCQMIRLRFAFSPPQATDAHEERIRTRNVFSALDVCAWRRWRRDGYLSVAIPPAGVALLHALEALDISNFCEVDPIMTGATKAEGPLPTDRLFDARASVTNGVSVLRWVIASSAAEVEQIAQQMSCGTLESGILDNRTLVQFTIAEFISQYRVLVDAMRLSPDRRRAKEISQRTTCNNYKTYTLTHRGHSDGSDVTDNNNNNDDDDGEWRPLPPLFAMTLDCFSHCSPINQTKLICSAAGVDYETTKTILQRRQYGEFDDYFEPNDTYMHYDDDDADADADKADSGLCIAEDTGLVTIRNCAALELLEASRRDGYAQLRIFAVLILQSFLRARWSARWNTQPLRRRAQRSAALLVQTALRYHFAVGIVTATARREMEWREHYRARVAERTHAEMTLAETGNLNVPIVEVCEMTPMAVRDNAHIHSESDESGGDEQAHEAKVKEATNIEKEEERVRSEGPCRQDDTGTHRLFSAVIELEWKGRSLLLRAEMKMRRGIITAFEERRRERWLIMEYRERRRLVEWGISERQKIRERVERRRRQRQQLLVQQHKQQQQQQAEEGQTGVEQKVGVKKKKEPVEGVKARESIHARGARTPSVTQTSHPPIVSSARGASKTSHGHTVLGSNSATRDHSTSLVTKRKEGPATVGSRSSGEVVVHIDMHDEDKGDRPQRCASRTRRSLKMERSVQQQQRPRVTTCSPRKDSLLQQESDDRVFIMLSEKHSRRDIRRRSAIAFLALREMTYRRVIFLAAVLERQELLARWRNVVLPYFLVTEAVRADFTAASLVLQDHPRVTLRSRSANLMSMVKSKERQQKFPHRPRQDVYAGEGNQSMSRERHTNDPRRNFLSKPDFGRISQLTAQPLLSEGGYRTGKVTQRRKVVTWADEPESGSVSLQETRKGVGNR